MARKAQPRVTRPSGIQTSANGNYFYWKCNVSGQETFADQNRFKDVVEKYGSEEKLFKTYVLRPVQKYVDAGFDAETIKTILEANDGKLPPIEANKMPSKVMVGKVKIDVQPEPKEVQYFPWSGNPDYFKSAPSVFNIEDESKNSCIYPNRNLDDQCYGCPVYSKCNCSAKLGEADWKKGKAKIKITEIAPFSD